MYPLQDNIQVSRQILMTLLAEEIQIMRYHTYMCTC